MTEQQAIEYINSLMSNYDKPIAVDTNPQYRLCNVWLSDRDMIALELAKESLRKQIPKKAIQDIHPRYGMGYEYYDWVCPTCHSFIAYECTTNAIDCFCQNCGQNIEGKEE